jgi:hypothetical protein
LDGALRRVLEQELFACTDQMHSGIPHLMVKVAQCIPVVAIKSTQLSGCRRYDLKAVFIVADLQNLMMPLAPAITTGIGSMMPPEFLNRGSPLRY